MQTSMRPTGPAPERGAAFPDRPDPGSRRTDLSDALTVELHTKAERRRIQRCAQESAASVLVADDALARLTLSLRHCPGINFRTRSLIAERVRTAMVAHHAALLRVTEIEALALRMGVQE